jgi:NAD(P)H-hydrate epimerase
MRAWDRSSIDARGIPERVLMESAGRAAAAVVHRLYPHGRVVAAVGAGNNGGDAIVVLRVLRSWGREVAAVLAGKRPDDAALLHGWEVNVVSAGDADAAFAGAAVIVDGLLGTGARGAPRDAETAAIEAMARSGCPIVALDGPSGIDMTTGARPGAAVRAEVTVTFGAPKRGLLLFPGREHAGRIVAVEVGFDPLAADGYGAQLVTPAWAAPHLPPVAPNAHKGTMGLVSVLAGRSGMAGASVLAAMGALRAGAGKVRVVTHADNRVIVQTAIPEALYADREMDGLAEELQDSQAIVAGPGMGTGDAEREMLRRVLSRGSSPVLLDADALTLLAADPTLRDAADRPLLLTPHPGEMARLLGKKTGDVTANPFAAAAEAVERFRCAVLLKGAPSIAAAPGERAMVNVAGHSGIATGGMGDVLGGIAGALLAVGCTPRDAAALALYFAGRAAEIAGRGRGLLPRDVVEALPAALMDRAEDAEPVAPGVLLDLPAAY